MVDPTFQREARVVPLLRVLLLATSALVIGLHNIFILGALRGPMILTFVFVAALYWVASTALLRWRFRKAHGLAWDSMFRISDIAMMGLAVHASGGADSWLFFLFLLPVADQLGTNFVRALLFMHASVLLYVAVMVVHAHTLGPVPLLPAAAKFAFLYLTGGYISLTALETEKLRVDLAKALGRAEEATAAKALFFAHMSHELRTPMNAILGMTTLMDDGSLPALQHERLQTLQRASYGLLTIANNILDFSKAEQGEMEFSLEPFDLHRMVRDVTTLFAPTLQQKGVALAVQLDPSLPQGVRGDEGRVRQVLTNLLNNASKFTDEGQVVLRVQPLAEGLRFSVQDTGPGLDVSEHAHIFGAYHQSKRYQDRGGSGLGLAICKSLVTGMGGRIWIESSLGHGATFFFDLPLPVAPLPPPIPEPQLTQAVAARPLRILVADDNRVNQIVAQGLLARLGYTCDLVADGEQALGKLRRAPYDVILLDMRMPKLDGPATARAIHREFANARPRLVAVTASVTPDDKQRCKDAGMDGFLSKPIVLTELARVLGV
jgi:signal transduction histidine kinase/CheY-like chemotaxis protein